MMLSLEIARVVVAGASATAQEQGLKPLTVVVLEAGGHASDETAALAGVHTVGPVGQPV